MEKRKYNKISIIAFVLSIITLLAFLFVVIKNSIELTFISEIEIIIIFSLLVITLVSGIGSLINIKESKERGKVFAIISILISILIVMYCIISTIVNSSGGEIEPQYDSNAIPCIPGPGVICE